MAGLHHAATGNLPLSRPVASTFWACTGCMRCKTYCDHDNRVADALAAGRAEAVSAEVEPQSVVRARAEHRQRCRRAADAGRKALGAAVDRAADTVFFPGCSGCTVAPDDVAAGLSLVEALAKEPARAVVGHCCGLPLWDAGDRDGFVGSVRRLVSVLGGARRVVMQDPGCLHALTKTARLAGVSFDLPLMHVSELAAEHLDTLRPVAALADAAAPIRYHDACRLGRGLGIYDEPRAALARVIGREPQEMFLNRDHAPCSGAGGMLPRTDPGTAATIAADTAREHEEVGGGTLVTACPSARRAFAKKGVDAVDLTALLARAVE